MQGSSLGLIAAFALLAGTAGCSLPQVLPLEGGTHAGPSPYGVWYEQHWATNSVLLAAADQPEDDGHPVAAAAAVGAAADERGEPEVAIQPEIESGTVNEDGYTAAPMDDDAASAAAEARAAADAAAAAANAPVEAHANNGHPGDGEQFDNSSPYQFPASSFQPGAQSGQGTAPSSNEPIRY